MVTYCEKDCPENLASKGVCAPIGQVNTHELKGVRSKCFELKYKQNMSEENRNRFMITYKNDVGDIETHVARYHANTRDLLHSRAKSCQSYLFVARAISLFRCVGHEISGET